MKPSIMYSLKSIYSLGTSNMPLKDLYISETTSISADSDTGGLKVRKKTGDNFMDVQISGGGYSGGGITFGNDAVGSKDAPINGGAVDVDIATNPNATIELSSNLPSSSLVINLSPTYWDTSVVGTSGIISLVERSPVGRTVIVDRRLKFQGGQASFYTTPSFSNAYSVDTLTYFLPSDSFGIGTYTRQFKTVDSNSVVKWLAGVGGLGNSSILGITAATDASGFYVTGNYNAASLTFFGASNVNASVPSQNFERQLTNVNAATLTSYNAFIAKYNSYGAVLWVAQLGDSTSGSTSSFQGVSTSSASDGGVFVTGTYIGAALSVFNADTTLFATLANSGGMDVFVVKYNSMGAVLWAGRISGASIESAPNVIGTQGDGGGVLACLFNSMSLLCVDGTGNSVTLSGNGTYRTAVIKFDGTGKIVGNGGLGWVASLGCGGGTSVRNKVALHVDPVGSVFVGGGFYGGPLSVYLGTSQTLYGTTLPLSSGGYDGFLVKFTASGQVALTSSSLPWMTHIGGSVANATSYTSISSTADGGVYVAGNYAATLTTYTPLNNSTADAVQPLAIGASDGFVMRLTSDGVKTWITTFKGTTSEYVSEITTSADDGCVIAGTFTSQSMSIYAGNSQTQYGTSLTNTDASTSTSDTYISKISGADGSVSWVSKVGGSGNDNAYAMTVIGDNGVVVVGNFGSDVMYIYDKIGTPYGITLGTTFTFPELTFSNCGATGSIGPTLSQVYSAYASAPFAQSSPFISMTIQGIQVWTVPVTGKYTFKVVGAHGGVGTTSTTSSRGGRGAVVTASFDLMEGTRIAILVGQAGMYSAKHGGGGGASFVALHAENKPLIVAGGGGGCRQGAVRNGTDASLSVFGYTPPAANTNDTTSVYTNNNTTFTYNGGVATVGYGGNAGMPSNYGDGGAGWFGNGQDDGTVSTTAIALRSSAVGGGYGTDAEGGFGGGGSGAGGNGGGGGGGYTGGNGGFIAGGGGSYVDASGTSKSFAIDTSRAYYVSGSAVHGYVTVSLTTSRNTSAFVVKMDPSGSMV